MDASPTPRRGLTLTYRPRRFHELVGQRHVAAVLGRLIAADRLPQQLLLTGGSGLGKTTVARIVAAAVLCTTPLSDRPDADACGQCESCLDVTDPDRLHPDVVELDAASHGGKDEIRELASRAVLSPVRGRRKVYIIDEVHAISGAGAQAALKLLEEPPAHVLFLLCTTNPEKLSSGAGGNGTIRGRCLELELLRPSGTELRDNLQRIAAAEGWDLSDDLADAAVTATAPDLGVRGTVMTLSKIAPQLEAGGVEPDAVAALLGLPPVSLFAQLTDAITAGRREGLFETAAQIRTHVPDTALRSAIVRHLRSRLTDESATALDDWRFETAVATPAGETHSDALLLRLVAPQLAAPEAATATASEQTLEALTVTVEKARAAYVALRDLLRDAERAQSAVPGSAQSVAPVATPAEPPARPAAEDDRPPLPDEPPLTDAEFDEPPLPVGEEPSFSPSPLDGPQAPPKQSPDRKRAAKSTGKGAAERPGPAPARATPPPSGKTEPPRQQPSAVEAALARSPLAKQLFTHLGQRDPELARAIQSCHITFEAQRLVVVADPELATRLYGPTWYPLLTDVSRAMGRRLTVRER